MSKKSNATLKLHSTHPYPFIMMAFELIDDCFEVEKRSSFTIPASYSNKLKPIDEFLGSLSREFLKDFCVGEIDRIEVLMNIDEAGSDANDLLVDYFAAHGA